MTISTHCLPNGYLAPYQVPVPAVNDGNVATVSSAAAGSRRGVVVHMHGMGGTKPYSIPYPVVDAISFVPVLQATLSAALAADGWVYVGVSYPEDFQSAVTTAIYNDVDNDSGHGSRFLNTTLLWWDHVVSYIRRKYGDTMPIVPYGLSWGGWHALQIAKNRQSTITAYAAHLPLVQLNALSGFTGLSSSAGLDLGAHHADDITVPGKWIWHTGDSVVGYTAQQTIYNNAVSAGRTVSSSTTADDHIVVSADVSAITGWFTSVVNPLCPANK